MAELVFWFVAAATIISAGFVVLNNQLIYSAVALLFTLFGVAGIYVFLWADFIAGIQILVYVGGILVLVIFGIMLTNKIKSVRISHKSMQQGVGGAVALWLFIFSIPAFLFINEQKTQKEKIRPLARLKEGFQIIIKIPGLLRFMIARMLYTDGLTVVFAFAGIYAAKVFSFPQEKVIMFAIAVNLFCGIGAIAGGFIEDRIGAFRTVRLSLFSLLFLGTGILLSPTELWFWVLG